MKTFKTIKWPKVRQSMNAAFFGIMKRVSAWVQSVLHDDTRGQEL